MDKVIQYYLLSLCLTVLTKSIEDVYCFEMNTKYISSNVMKIQSTLVISKLKGPS